MLAAFFSWVFMPLAIQSRFFTEGLKASDNQKKTIWPFLSKKIDVKNKIEKNTFFSTFNGRSLQAMKIQPSSSYPCYYSIQNLPSFGQSDRYARYISSPSSSPLSLKNRTITNAAGQDFDAVNRTLQRSLFGD
jgi:hypothetical protein